jgi:hypothetical protein
MPAIDAATLLQSPPLLHPHPHLHMYTLHQSLSNPCSAFLLPALSPSSSCLTHAPTHPMCVKPQGSTDVGRKGGYSTPRKGGGTDKTNRTAIVRNGRRNAQQQHEVLISQGHRGECEQCWSAGRRNSAEGALPGARLRQQKPKRDSCKGVQPARPKMGGRRPDAGRGSKVGQEGRVHAACCSGGAPPAAKESTA